MTVTQRILTPPTFTLAEGWVVSVNANGAETSREWVSNRVYTGITQSGTQNWRNGSPVRIIAPFIINIASIYPCTDWQTFLDTVTTTAGGVGGPQIWSNLPGNHCIIGGDTNLASTRPVNGELFTTVSGKNPCVTKSYRMLTNGLNVSYTVRSTPGNASGDNTVFKARVYYGGEYSAVNTVEIIVLRDPATRTIYEG